MDQCTHEVRAEYWKKIIQACGQRPAGQSAKSWMDENGISEQSYYHWQRRFRKQAYEEMKGNSSVPAASCMFLGQDNRPASKRLYRSRNPVPIHKSPLHRSERFPQNKKSVPFSNGF